MRLDVPDAQMSQDQIGMSFFKRLFSREEQSPTIAACGAPGERSYAVGDVHGRLDLLNMVLAQIETDMAQRTSRPTNIVFLGDLVDRGPCSAQVIERLRTYEPVGAQVSLLLGNHEEFFLNILDGDSGLFSQWLKFGGAECVESYGLSVRELLKLPRSEAVARVRAAVPEEHVAFLRAMSNQLRFGDYLFVHAGIRPGVPIDEQNEADLRWIREPFLNCPDDLGCVVVHGHTISNGVEERHNRIGIDTGAYRSGVLTAIGIEDGQRWYIAAQEAGAELAA